MRTFSSSDAFVSHPAWRDALGGPSHVVQFPALLVARTKSAATEMLVGLGLGEASAQGIVKQVKAAPQQGRDWSAVIETGAIDLSVPGLYFSTAGRNGSTVVRVTGPKSAEVLGEFGYDRTCGRLFFIPASASA